MAFDDGVCSPNRASLTRAFPRASLGHFPTPLEPAPRLSAEHGLAAPILVKRDDCSGLAFGGNKVRQLEYYMGDAQACGATMVLITGAVQSNYVRTVAASAARLGMKCVAQLEDRVVGKGPLYHSSGNVLLDHLLGAEVMHYAHGEDESGADANLEARAQSARAAGEVPYVIHLSEQPRPLGALGYVAGAEEIVEQLAHDQGAVHTVVVASGSAVTHAGLLVGLRAMGWHSVDVVGACVRRGASQQAARVLRVARTVEAMLGCAQVVQAADVIVDDEALGEGYGTLNTMTSSAIRDGARFEGLILDPVYTGKSFACALKWAGQRAERAGSTLFVHTGGSPAVFAYGDTLIEALT
jgi:1-aminocyclopropane-1-carboxylate deaminase/D-cysteine desulfhydrase-like pyridoxal-dependent ACC family enzyme